MYNLLPCVHVALVRDSLLATRALALDNTGCKIWEEVSREIPTREFELSSQLILEWLVVAVLNICSCESHTSCESRPRLEAFTASGITFHDVRNHKAVYAQRCLLIWFIVCLLLYSLKILFKKSPKQLFIIFSWRNKVMPTIKYAFLWSLGAHLESTHW